MPENYIDSEKKIERRLVDEVKRLGGWCIKLVPTFVSGLPDRMCLLPGACIVFVETKTTKQKLRPIQKVVITKIRKLGFRVDVIDTLAGVDELIEEFNA